MSGQEWQKEDTDYVPMREQSNAYRVSGGRTRT